MLADANSGRQFGDIVVEYNSDYRPEKTSQSSWRDNTEPQAQTKNIRKSIENLKKTNHLLKQVKNFSNFTKSRKGQT